MAGYDVDPPDNQALTIKVTTPGGGTIVQYNNFYSYDYVSHFLSPSDTGTFTLDTAELSTADVQALSLGARLEVSLNDVVQSIGNIDDLHYHGSRQGGSLLEVRFRDWLARAVDAELDPQGVRYMDANTFDQLLTATFAPFGVKAFVNDNAANRNAIRGRKYGVKSSKRSGKPLKSYVLHELKPYDNEGAFAFASRVSQRFGLWLWPAVDGQTLVVSSPEFNQDASYTIQHKLDSSSIHNNVLDWAVTKSRREQPWFIVARGFGGGGADPKTSMQSIIINPYIQTTLNPASFYPNTRAVIPPFDVDQYSDLSFIPIDDPSAAPQFLRDTESHNAGQLASFLLRELSLRTRKLLTASYTIEGHALNGQPIALDTIIDVDDDVTNLHLQLWIIGRRFHKAAGSSGTTTTIECILPGTLVF